MQREFQLSPTMRRIGLALMVTIGVVYFALAPFDFLEDDLGFAGFFFMTLFAFFSLGAYWYVRHNGVLLLTDEMILLRRFGKDKSLEYKEIVKIKERDNHMPPNYTLYSNTSTLKFSRLVENFATFYDILQSKTKALQETDISLPLILQLTSDFYLKITLALISIGAIIANLFWVALRNTEMPLSEIIFGILTVLFVLALFIGAMLPNLRNKFVRIDFTNGEIRAYPVVGSPRTFNTQKIKSIKIEKLTRQVNLQHRLIWRTMQSVTHPLVIRFSNGQELTITEHQSWDLGYAPERLAVLLRNLYQQRKLELKFPTRSEPFIAA